MHESYLVAILKLHTRCTYLYNWCNGSNAYATRSYTPIGHVLLCHYIICLYWQYNLDTEHAWTADWSVCETQLPMHSINNCIDGSRFSSQGCCLTVAWKRCRDGTLPIRWPLVSCIIPTLFAYFLACHIPTSFYIFNVFYLLVSILFWC